MTGTAAQAPRPDGTDQPERTDAVDGGAAGGAGRRRSVAVLGPGGVGGLVGGLLARAGHRVVCVAGERTVEVLRERGLTIRSGPYGDFTAAVAADTVLREEVDACVLATKEMALAAALERVPPQALGGGLVLPLLNGFEHMAALRARFPAEQVVSGSIRVESTRTAPGSIVHSSPFARVELASRAAPGTRVAALGGLLADAGFQVAVRAPGDEDAVLWEKMSFLVPLALLTTRYEVPLGGVRSTHRSELVAVLRELAQVARAVGVAIDVEAVLTGVVDKAPEGMRSSMQRDAAAGRPTELDALGGAVLREAARRGLAAPVTARLVAELSGRELSGRGGPATPPGRQAPSGP